MSIRRESTSKQVAAIAGRILEALKDAPTHEGADPSIYVGYWIFPKWKGMAFAQRVTSSIRGVSIDDMQSLAASALTQAVDKPKRKRTKNVRRSSK